MSKVWLPIKQFMVEHGGRRRTILLPIPADADLGQMREIEEWQKEKTLAELKRLPPLIPTHSNEEIAEALKQFISWKNRRKD